MRSEILIIPLRCTTCQVLDNGDLQIICERPNLTSGTSSNNSELIDICSTAEGAIQAEERRAGIDPGRGLHRGGEGRARRSSRDYRHYGTHSINRDDSYQVPRPP